MSSNARSLLNSVLALTPTERAEIAGELLASLDRPDPVVDAAWAREAEARIRAFDAGEARAFTEKEVFAELENA